MVTGKRKREVSACIPCYTRKQKVKIPPCVPRYPVPPLSTIGRGPAADIFLVLVLASVTVNIRATDATGVASQSNAHTILLTPRPSPKGAAMKSTPWRRVTGASL